MRVRSNCGPECGAAGVHSKRDGLALLLLDESSKASVVGCGTKLTENVGPLRVASAPYSSLMHTGLACNMRTPLPSQAEPATSVAHKANGGSGGEGAAHCAAVPAAGRVGSSSTPTRRAAPPSTRPARRRPDTPGPHRIMPRPSVSAPKRCSEESANCAERMRPPHPSQSPRPAMPWTVCTPTTDWGGLESSRYALHPAVARLALASRLWR